MFLYCSVSERGSPGVRIHLARLGSSSLLRIRLCRLLIASLLCSYLPCRYFVLISYIISFYISRLAWLTPVLFFGFVCADYSLPLCYAFTILAGTLFLSLT